MDKAFAIGCGFIAATILIVFVICALLDHRQLTKLGLPLVHLFAHGLGNAPQCFHGGACASTFDADDRVAAQPAPFGKLLLCQMGLFARTRDRNGRIKMLAFLLIQLRHLRIVELFI